ncbi:hypothetical protein WJX72_008963 [[Myrmecia] bisecta]|uniref:Guanylate cyclase domain-containing protein n=1 Tax=[Myrmecia] bisecta TaxID=41462 RepID=A0AAW1QG82_9CHLO
MMHCPTPISCSLREDVSLVALRIKDGERLMHDVPTPKAFNWLHKVHLLIDGLCEKHRLSKLSSEGCFVLLGAGVDSEDADHAASALRFACALLKEAREVSLPHTMEKLQLQVALHCGAVTSAILGFKMLKLQTYGPAVVAVQDVVAQAPGNTIVASDTFLLRLRSASSWQLFRSLDVHGRTSQSLFILQPSPSVAAAPLPEDKCSPSPSPCQPRPSTWKTEGEEPEAAPREAKTRPVGSTCSQDSAALCGLDQGLMARWGLDLRFADSTDERRFQLQRAAKMFAPDVAYMALTSGLQLYVLWTMNYLASVFGCVMMVLAVWPLLVALATPRAFQKHRTAILVVGRIVRCSFWFLNVLTNSAAMLGQSSQALVMRTTLSSGLVWHQARTISKRRLAVERVGLVRISQFTAGRVGVQHPGA